MKFVDKIDTLAHEKRLIGFTLTVEEAEDLLELYDIFSKRYYEKQTHGAITPTQEEIYRRINKLIEDTTDYLVDSIG